MNRHELDIYIELYKRKDYDKIPLGKYADGVYYYPTVKQLKALEYLNDSVTTSIGYGGSARSGKSLLECFVITFDCLAYPAIAWGLARKELTTLKRTVLLTLFKTLDFYGLEVDTDFTYNQQLNKIIFSNLSDVFLIDTAFKPTDPLNTRFGGFELTRCSIDESNETSEKVITKLFERTGWRLNDKYLLKRKLLETFNPDKNHVYPRFYKPWKEGKETSTKKFVNALPTDNPHPSVREWVEDMLLTADEQTIQRQIYGNFEYDDNPLSLLPNYDDICDLFTNDFVQGNGQRYLIADIAYMGADVFVITIWDGFVIEKVIAIDKIDETAIGNKLLELAQEYRVPHSNIVYDADGLRKFTSNSLKRLTAAKPFTNNAAPIKDKQFGNLKTECAFKLKELIEKKMIYCECKDYFKQIMFDLESVRREPMDDEMKIKLEKKSKHKDRTGKSPDFFDSLLMRMYFEIKNTGGWG